MVVDIHNSQTYSLRIPEKIILRVKARAEAERRTFHNTCLKLIEEGIDVWEQEQGE